MGNFVSQSNEVISSQSNKSIVESKTDINCKEFSVIEKAQMLKFKKNEDYIEKYKSIKPIYITENKKYILKQIYELFDKLPELISEKISEKNNFDFNYRINVKPFVSYIDCYDDKLFKLYLEDNNKNYFYDYIVEECNSRLNNYKYNCLINIINKIYNVGIYYNGVKIFKNVNEII